MKIIQENEIVQTVRDLLIEANIRLTSDVVQTIANCKKNESSPVAQSVLSEIEDNLHCAKENQMPICQDTGMAVVFIRLGMDIHIESSKSLLDIVNLGVASAYTEGYLRMSVVADPFHRVNTGNNTPAVLYTELIPGTVTPKGFGSENMSRICMFNPIATKEDIRDFVLETIATAGSKPCPPLVVGIGIGGTFDYAAYLAKKALSRPLDVPHPHPFYAEFEQALLKEINTLQIGPQGFGGDTTALGVAIETYPTHIAGLPVAVNINCHVARHKTAVL